MRVFPEKGLKAIGLSAVLAIAAPVLSPAAEPAPARKPTIVVDRAVCRALPRHVPAPDVAYRPGVDVHGKPVAPAELGGAPAALADRIEIDLTLDLAGRFGVPVDALYGQEAWLGLVTVEDGRILFNGAPIGEPAAEELVAVCARQGGS